MARSQVIGSILFLFALLSQSSFAADIMPPPTLQEPNQTAAETTNLETPPPALPRAEDDSRNIPEPEVRIIRKKDTVIEEYRVNGGLRYIKVTPTNGPAYYLVDTDGDGVLETRENDLDNPPINRWILLKW